MNNEAQKPARRLPFRVSGLTEMEKKSVESTGFKTQDCAAVDLVGLGFDLKPASDFDPNDLSGDYLAIVVARVPANLFEHLEVPTEANVARFERALVLYPSVRAVVRTHALGSGARCPSCKGTSEHVSKCPLDPRSVIPRGPGSTEGQGPADA